MTSTPEQPYDGVVYLDAQEAAPTVVARAEDHPFDELPTFFDQTYRTLFPALGQAGIAPAGPAHALYTKPPGETVDLEVGIVVDRRPDADLGSGLIASEIPGGRIAATTHLGSFDGLGAAWQGFMAKVSGDGHTPALPFWEVYVTEPSPDMDPATLRTDLYTLLAD